MTTARFPSKLLTEKMKASWTLAICCAILAGCATHKDLLYTFTAVGEVACVNACEEPKLAVVRIVDTGLDYKRKHVRFEIGSQEVSVGDSFRFDSEYFWGYTKISGVKRLRRSVTIEVVAPGCQTASVVFDLEKVRQDKAHFTLEANVLALVCTD